MVKKILKYAKFVVCCALIVSLIAPSYAALSASDGSAFVTKAEFDAALADFNSRLTTFEAGINSKIDSQVTSYLDRNGIWNGKNQTVNYNNWYGSNAVLAAYPGVGGALKLNAAATANNAMAWYGNLSDGTWWNQGSMPSYQLTTAEGVNTFQPFVQAASKSGLCWVSGSLTKFHHNSSSGYKWVNMVDANYTFNPYMLVVHNLMLASKSLSGSVTEQAVLPGGWEAHINQFSPYPNTSKSSTVSVNASIFISKGESVGVVPRVTFDMGKAGSQYYNIQSRFFGLVFVPSAVTVY